jgi:hypothetical protein
MVVPSRAVVLPPTDWRTNFTRQRGQRLALVLNMVGTRKLVLQDGQEMRVWAMTKTPSALYEISIPRMIDPPRLGKHYFLPGRGKDESDDATGRQGQEDSPAQANDPATRRLASVLPGLLRSVPGRTSGTKESLLIRFIMSNKKPAARDGLKQCRR